MPPQSQHLYTARDILLLPGIVLQSSESWLSGLCILGHIMSLSIVVKLLLGQFLVGYVIITKPHGTYEISCDFSALTVRMLL